MERKQILALIKENLTDGNLYCEKAHEIAGRYKIKLAEIGRICDEENIKIKGCQLGCF
jgi:LAO/AO transport system kinase